MFCIKCGAQLSEGVAFCSWCGAQVAPAVGQVTADVSPKSRLAVSLLALFVGEFGVHRFYAGKIVTAVVMLAVTLLAYVMVISSVIGESSAVNDDPWWIGIAVGILLGSAVGIWSIVDTIIALMGGFRDSQGKPIKKW